MRGWRLDNKRFQGSWDSGEGAFQFGGRWNSKGTRAVYACTDPSTAVLEVAVHKGFRVLDSVAHVLTCFEIIDPSAIPIIDAGAVANANWLTPGLPSAGQQQFGDELLARYGSFLIPSVVSRHAWNLVFDPQRKKSNYQLVFQEDFALDTRLHPPA
jgi:RES domain-containing protein